jgi:hypothetical protein
MYSISHAVNYIFVYQVYHMYKMNREDIVEKSEEN